MKKIGKFIKSNIKLFIGIIVGAVIAGGSAAVVSAIAGSSVTYTDTNGIGATTVQGAIDKLYTMAASSANPEYTKMYTGANPNNYVTFNGETAGWRILGAYGQNLKLVRASALSDERRFSSGDNKWSGSELQVYLNETYYNGLTEEAKSMLADGVWFVGVFNLSDTAMNIYEDARKSTWTGKVGLLNGYEVIFTANTACWSINNPLYSNGSCRASTWLKGSTDEWIINPYKTSGWSVYKNGSNGSFARYYSTSVGAVVRPVVYLNSNVTITSGSGTSADPYILQ